MQSESISLRFKNGPSDKVYNASLEPRGDGWVVNFSYGKYGSALKPGTKTKDPISFDKAKKVYDKIVGEKMSKGYSPEGDGVAFAGTEHAGRVTGYQPQLLNAVSEEDILALIASEPGNWAGQEKFDGERRGLKVAGGEIVGANRKGLQVPVRAETEAAVAKLAAHGLTEFEIDCEAIGGWLAVFDVLALDGADLKDESTKTRLEKLQMFETICAEAEADDVFRGAATWDLSTPELASEMIARFRAKNAEGVVFKRLSAPYSAGRPNSGGDQLKLKFTNDATVRVADHTEGKRSVSMELVKDGDWVRVGNVTIPTSHTVPPIGTLVDVTYLYAYDGGSLYQPVYRGARTDLDESACTVEQLTFKAPAVA